MVQPLQDGFRHHCTADVPTITQLTRKYGECVYSLLYSTPDLYQSGSTFEHVRRLHLPGIVSAALSAAEGDLYTAVFSRGGGQPSDGKSVWSSEAMATVLEVSHNSTILYHG